MTTKITFIGAMCLSALAFTACNNTEPKAEEPKEITTDVAKDANSEMLSGDKERDAKLIVEIYSGSVEEIDMSDEADKHAVSKKVKEFASMMIDQHSEMNKQLEELAANLDITLPSDINKGDKEDITDMDKKKGMDYDKAYIDAAIDAHKTTIDKATKLSQEGYNEQVKKFFTDALPKLKHHLMMAEETKAAIEKK